MDTDSLLADAKSARRSGQADRALALARAAYAAAPDEAGCCFLLCVLLLDRGDPEANGMLVLLEQFPMFAPGWEDLARALSERHAAAAMVALGRAAAGFAALEVATPSGETALRLGRVLREAGDFKAARRALERAVERSPALAEAWFVLGLVRQDLGEALAAAASFRAALRARADFHEAAFNLGVALQETGALEEALDAYARAWRLRPESFGRIAQALVSPACGRLWLHPSDLRRELVHRA